MAWTPLVFVFGQEITAAELNQLYGNFSAMAVNDSGAPQFDTDSMSDAIVGKDGELTSSTASTSGAVPQLSTVDIAMNNYSFFPMLFMDAALDIVTSDGGEVDQVGRFALSNPQLGADHNYDIAYRYLS